jgi:hypothetical protein
MIWEVEDRPGAHARLTLELDGLTPSLCYGKVALELCRTHRGRAGISTLAAQRRSGCEHFPQGRQETAGMG